MTSGAGHNCVTIWVTVVTVLLPCARWWPRVLVAVLRTVDIELTTSVVRTVMPRVTMVVLVMVEVDSALATVWVTVVSGCELRRGHRV